MWKDNKLSLYVALQELNHEILAISECEQSALDEAKAVKNILDKRDYKDITLEWLVDSVHQAAIDLQVNRIYRKGK